MSSLLEQAIIDAKALRESALKNAEQAIIEKYAPEIKQAVQNLLEQDEDFPEDNHIVFTESLAWYLGYKYFKALGFEIDREEYMAEAAKSLDAYARSINEKNNNFSFS